MTSLPREQARAWLVCRALFFAMRSCEYTFTGNGERKTRPVRPCDIAFWRGAEFIPHDSPLLHKADSISIDSGDQKSEIKNETVSQDNNGKADLNPVTMFAKTIKRLRSYPGYKYSWSICTFHDGKTFTKINSREILP